MINFNEIAKKLLIIFLLHAPLSTSLPSAYTNSDYSVYDHTPGLSQLSDYGSYLDNSNNHHHGNGDGGRSSSFGYSSGGYEIVRIRKYACAIH